MFSAEVGDAPLPSAKLEMTEEPAPTPESDAKDMPQEEPAPEPRPPLDSDTEPTKAPAPEVPPNTKAPEPMAHKTAEESEKAEPLESKTDAEPTPQKKVESKETPAKAPRSIPKPVREVAPKPKAAEKPIPATKAKASAEAPKQRIGGGRSRAPEGGDGGKMGGGIGTDRAAVNRYLAELQRAIAKHRRYPRQAQKRELEGVVTVYFVIHGNGRITDVRIAKSSGSGLLDEAAKETLKRLGTFKPIPREIGRNRWPLRVPIRFALR